MAVALLLALAALFITVPLSPSAAQPSSDAQVIRDKMEGLRAIVDGVEAALGRDGLRSSDLDDLRARLDPVRAQLDAGIDVLDPLLADFNKRIQEIGAKPAADAPPESPSITEERDTLIARAADLDGVLKQAKLLKVRVDQMSDRITSRRRALFTDTLFARSYSVLDPQLWISAAAAIPMEVRGVNYLLSDWQAYANTRMSPLGQIAIVFGVLLIIGAVVILRMAVARPLRHFEKEDSQTQVSRLRACSLSMLAAISGMAAAPIATFASLALLNAFDLLPPRVNEVVQGFVTAVIIVAVGHGLLSGALAPDAPRRRVVPFSDDMARFLHNNVAIGLWILAASAVLNNLHRALVVPVPLTVATSAAMSLALVAVVIYTIRRLGNDMPDGEETDPATGEPMPKDGAIVSVEDTSTATLQWVRFPFWLLNFAVLAALVGGYVGFASFLSSRTLVAVVMAGALYLIIALINSFLIDGIATGHGARNVAKTLGVRQGSLELIAVLVAGVLKAVAVLVMVILVVGTMGTSTADLRDVASRITFGFTIGTSTVTIGDVLSAMLFLAIGIGVARAIQRWFSVAILPRTSFDTGLQNSISTIIGYVGAIAVIAMAMGQIGLNLENIALVAGALSVGIGFGLQSIVSNFVSGLILLAERPIRVGDTILVKGEEGYVRRISVRATEIETFDRAMVLIPNSDLITGMVKNFTHANTTGRIIVKVNVAYDADADEVREILIGCACDHPQVLRSPPPRVFLMNFGDSYLQFELRCVVANVDYALTVRSDLHFSVLDRLKTAKIGIPYTPWNIYRGGPLDGASNPDKDDGESEASKSDGD